MQYFGLFGLVFDIIIGLGVTSLIGRSRVLGKSLIEVSLCTPTVCVLIFYKATNYWKIQNSKRECFCIDRSLLVC